MKIPGKMNASHVEVENTVRYWPVYRQQTTVFAPDDPLLANIEVETGRCRVV